MLMKSIRTALKIVASASLILAITGCATPTAVDTPPIQSQVTPEQAFVDGVRGMDPVPPAFVKGAEILDLGEALCKIIRTDNWDGFNRSDPYAEKLISLAKRTIC